MEYTILIINTIFGVQLIILWGKYRDILCMSKIFSTCVHYTAYCCKTYYLKKLYDLPDTLKIALKHFHAELLEFF